MAEGVYKPGYRWTGSTLVAQEWRFSRSFRLPAALCAVVAIRQEGRFEAWEPEFGDCQVVEAARTAVADR